MGQESVAVFKMNCLGRVLGTIVVCFFLGTAGQAQETNPPEFHGPFMYSFDDGVERTVFLSGGITDESARDFRSIIRGREIDALLLDSGGGDMFAGLEIAEIVKDREIETVVLEESHCASACSLIFLAGSQRTLLGRLGVHQFRSPDNPLQPERQTQRVAGEVIEVLNSFDTPSVVLERMFMTESTCMYWFDANNAELFRRRSAEEPALQTSEAMLSGVTECSDRTPPDIGRPQQPIDPEPALSPDEIVVLVQRQLNRVGCNLGGADGVVGPRSIAAMREFSRRVGIEYDATNFQNLEFLEAIQGVTSRVCPEPPAPTAPNLAGDWNLTARCSYTRAVIQGWFTASPVSATRYAFTYANNQGETGTGTIVQNGNLASVTVSWGNGNRTTSHMTVLDSGARMTGQSDNGCSFTAWR